MTSIDSPIQGPAGPAVDADGLRGDFIETPLSGPQPLFDGDLGQLTEDLRLVQLKILQSRFLSCDQHPREYKLICQNETQLRSRLHEVFIDLVVDREREVVFKRRIGKETGEFFPTLIRERSWNREETVLLVLLRQAYTTQMRNGQEAAFIDRSELLGDIEQMRPQATTDLAKAAADVNRAIDNLKKEQFLLPAGKDDDRFRIPSIVAADLAVPELGRLLEVFTGQADGGYGSGHSPADDTAAPGVPRAQHTIDDLFSGAASDEQRRFGEDLS